MNTLPEKLGGAKQMASEADRGTSIALIAVACAFATAAMAGMIAVVEKLTVLGRWGVVLLAIAAVGAFVTSIYWGGRGCAWASTPGPNHPFNRQAQWGLGGVALLIASAVMSALTFSPSADSRRLADLEGRLQRLEAEQQASRLAMDRRLSGIEGRKIEVTCIHSERPQPCYEK